jgi:hypothetical protein
MPREKKKAPRQPVSVSCIVSASKTQECRVRRKAARAGYRVVKSRQWKYVPHSNNLGEYMLLDAARNLIVLGQRFDATLDDIEAFLT